MVLFGILRVVIFVELSKESVAFAARPNPAPSRAALDRSCLPALRASDAPLVRPPFPLCVPMALEAEQPTPWGAAAVRLMGSAPSPKAGGGQRGGEMPRLSGAAAQARIPLGRGLSARDPGRVNNKARAAAPDRYFPGSNKVGLATFAPPLPPNNGLQNGATWAESQGSVAVVAHPWI